MKIRKWILSIGLGLITGAGLNMLLVILGPHIIVPPDGADVTTAEGLANAIPKMGLQHFIFPFMAHFIGTFSSVYISSVLFPDKKGFFVWFFGILFLAGGVAAVFQIPAPLWFVMVDLSLAYIPAAFLAGICVKSKVKS